MLLQLFLGVIAAILLAYLRWTGQIAKYKGIAHIPGPTPLPIVGNYLLFRNFKELLPTLMKLCNKYGSIFRLWLGFTPLLVVTDPEMIEFILRSSTYTSRGDMYRFIKPWLNNSMLTSMGDTWERQTKAVYASMNFKLLEKYLSIFNSSCDVLVEILSAKADGNTCNIAPLMSSYSLDNIAECAMGVKLNTQRQPKNEYAKALHFMKTIPKKRHMSIWKRFDCLFVFSNDYRGQREACNILHDFGAKVIEEKRKQLLESKQDDDDMDDNGKKMTQYLDILLCATINGKPLSDEQIRDDISGFIFAGHDTTATVLKYLFYHLSYNQEVQNKIIDELSEIFGKDKNRPCTMQDTCKMRYMERVIKESMRYYTPGTITARQLQQDVHYKNSVLPKGLNILFFIHGLHRNPDIHDDPDVFNPDRFISEDSIKPYSYLPFSAGPLNCKGQKFALIEIKVTVAKLLMNFKFLPAGPGGELKMLPYMVLRTSNGINVRIKRRDF